MDKNEIIDNILEGLPKNIWVEDEVFEIVIIKQDHNYTSEDSFLALYSKRNIKGYSTANYLLKGKGSTLSSAIDSLKDEYNSFSEYLSLIGGKSNLRKGFKCFCKKEFNERKEFPWLKTGKLYRQNPDK